MNIKFYNLSGNTGTYHETDLLVPGVVLGSALNGMASIGRASETDAIETALRIEKTSTDWQLWRAAFNFYNTTSDEWYLIEVLRESGTLVYGDTVSVTAVPEAGLFHDMINLIDSDADYPIIISASSVDLTIDHHAKTVILTSNESIAVTIDPGFGVRPWWTRVIQAGIGQITLSSASNRNYNNAGTNVAHSIPNVRYKATSIYSMGTPNFLVTV